MKKIILCIITILFSFFIFNEYTFAECDYRGGSISDELVDCLSDSVLVKGDDASIIGGFSSYITKWTRNVSLFLGVFAVFGIAVGAFMLTTSAGESDRASKAKDVIKWSIIGFIAVITASLIINLIIRIMYSMDEDSVSFQNQPVLIATIKPGE